jgi:hypothetical protein
VRKLLRDGQVSEQTGRSFRLMRNELPEVEVGLECEICLVEPEGAEMCLVRRQRQAKLRVKQDFINTHAPHGAEAPVGFKQHRLLGETNVPSTIRRILAVCSGGRK